MPASEAEHDLDLCGVQLLQLRCGDGWACTSVSLYGGHHGHGLPLRRHNWENVPVLREGTGSWPPDGRNSLVVA